MGDHGTVKLLEVLSGRLPFKVALASARDELLFSDRVNNNSMLDATFMEARYGDTEMRNLASKIGGTIKRVYDPLMVRLWIPRGS